MPGRSHAVAYKGSCQLDLRTAELTADVTTIEAYVYKGSVEVLVPPGARAETSGFGLTGGRVENEADEDPPAAAPVVRVRGLAYKGAVVVRTSPPSGRP